MPVIAVVVPVYKVEAYLKRCVESIRAQSYTNWIAVLIDDGSPDGSGAICDEYSRLDSRIYVIHQRNRGLSGARNAAIAYLKERRLADLVMFLDGDDWLHRQALEVMYGYLDREKVRIVVAGFDRADGFVLRDTTTDMSNVYGEVLTPTDFLLACENWPKKGIYVQNIACAKLYGLELFKDIRYPEDVRAHEDVYTTYRIVFSQQKIVLIRAALYFYFSNPASITGFWSSDRLHTVWGHQKQIEYFQAENYIQALGVAVRQQFCRIPWVIDECKQRSGFENEIEQLRLVLKDLFEKYGKRFEIRLSRYPAAWRLVRPFRAKFYLIARILDLGPMGVIEKLMLKIRKVKM